MQVVEDFVSSRYAYCDESATIVIKQFLSHCIAKVKTEVCHYQSILSIWLSSQAHFSDISRPVRTRISDSGILDFLWQIRVHYKHHVVDGEGVGPLNWSELMERITTPYAFASLHIKVR